MNWNEMKAAVEQAKTTIGQAECFTDDFAKMLVGRLRRVNKWTLAELKRELRNFNPQRRTWKP